MKLPRFSLKTALRNLLIFGLMIGIYYALDGSTTYLMTQHPVLLHGLFVGGGMLVALLGLLIAWGEQAQRARITLSPHGQKKPFLVILLPLGFFLLMGAGMTMVGLSYWAGERWNVIAGVCMLAALLMVVVSVLYEQHVKRAS